MPLPGRLLEGIKAPSIHTSLDRLMNYHNQEHGNGLAANARPTQCTRPPRCEHYSVTDALGMCRYPYIIRRVSRQKVALRTSPRVKSKSQDNLFNSVELE